MVEAVKRDFAEEGVKKTQVVSSGPDNGKAGKGVWANDKCTRGQKVSDKTLKQPTESTLGSMTKLDSLKR